MAAKVAAAKVAMRDRAPAVMAVLGLATLSLAGGCPATGPDTRPGVGGLDGVIAFEAPDDLFFSTSIAIGSTFEVVARPGVSSDQTILDGDAVDVGTTNPAVLTVEPVERDDGEFTFKVTIVGGGTARIAVTNGDAVLDRFDLTGVPAGITRLVDAALIPYGAVDVALPARFGLLESRDTGIAIAAVDRCGAGIIDLASTVRAEPIDDDVELDDVVTIENEGITGFTVNALEAGNDFRLILETPGLAPLEYRVDAVDSGDIDSIEIAIASADSDAATGLAWGRAYTNGNDVIGLDYSWSGDQPRVGLDAATGPAVNVTIAAASVDEFGNPVDEPASLYADAVGETTELDLLAVTATVNTRGDAPSRPGEEDATTTETTTSSGCGEGETEACNPLTAAVSFFGLRGLRRLRRRPSSSSSPSSSKA